jgi:hypothetical protein
VGAEECGATYAGARAHYDAQRACDGFRCVGVAAENDVPGQNGVRGDSDGMNAGVGAHPDATLARGGSLVGPEYATMRGVGDAQAPVAQSLLPPRRQLRGADKQVLPSVTYDALVSGQFFSNGRAIRRATDFHILPLGMCGYSVTDVVTRPGQFGREAAGEEQIGFWRATRCTTPAVR